MESDPAEEALVEGLQMAYSGEWGAVHAYLGHRAALPHGPDRELIVQILKDELEHRKALLSMLHACGRAEDPKRETRMNRVGRTIGCLCGIGGWFVPMYGAARLESANIREYEVLARLAHAAGHDEFVDELLTLGEVEWDHEWWLRERASSHWLWRFFPKWIPPAPRESIRERYEENSSLIPRDSSFWR